MTDKDGERRMKRQPCSSSNSVLEGDLELAAQYNIIDQLKVLETDMGFYVVAIFADKVKILEVHKNKGLPDWFYILSQLLAEPGKEWYLTTRRDRESPRLFKDLKRLNEYLQEKDPRDGFTLIRNQELPGTPKTKVGRGVLTLGAKKAKIEAKAIQVP
ncbi:hypothetical protein [Xanthomonas fragariae]|uniref:hypothetical protein n=1 Tax=Xanthomonas fragariae TaxID=48664 RepID=UPI000D5511AB|nr:hypothetical protein [Xanthomonas fragariae]MEA5249888.1 hypothetical protein [Xanthomonas fragariae]